MLHFEAELRREAHRQANSIEAVAIGYGGVRAKDGPRTMQRVLDALRKD